MTQDSFQADPHPVYAQWRRAEPVRRVTMGNGRDAWLVTRYEDARQALTDPRLSKQPASGEPQDDVGAALSRHMLAADPPDHTRLRRLVSAAFTARRIELLRPRIEELTDELLDAMSRHDRVDFLDAFAFPLPIQVICELLGVPSEDRDKFREWSTALVSGAIGGMALAEARRAIVEYIRKLIAERRTGPGDDLISGLIAVRDAEDRLSEDELTSMVFLLLIAGHETTVNLLGNGTYLLLSERDRWERLRAERELLPSAIEEFLRYEGPVETATFRFAAEDLEIGGRPIAAGDPVFVVLLSANRDDHFPYGDQLLLDRTPNPHLAFGHGIHYCLGAPLARLEAAIAFDRLLTRFPALELDITDEPLGWRPGLLIRGLQKLPVRTA
nr:cytochrome P450 [uncultured Actinoplanes sp.]